MKELKDDAIRKPHLAAPFLLASVTVNSSLLSFQLYCYTSLPLPPDTSMILFTIISQVSYHLTILHYRFLKAIFFKNISIIPYPKIFKMQYNFNLFTFEPIQTAMFLAKLQKFLSSVNLNASVDLEGVAQESQRASGMGSPIANSRAVLLLSPNYCGAKPRFHFIISINFTIYLQRAGICI